MVWTWTCLYGPRQIFCLLTKFESETKIVGKDFINKLLEALCFMRLDCIIGYLFSSIYLVWTSKLGIELN